MIWRRTLPPERCEFLASRGNEPWCKRTQAEIPCLFEISQLSFLELRFHLRVGPELEFHPASSIIRAVTLLAGLMLVGQCRTGTAAENPADSDATLRWGGDQEGGGPYIFSRDDDPTRVVGFEVDLADALARQLGERAEFVQCDWNRMLLVLDRGNIDLALNGYEYTDERGARYLASLPYYIYELGLCARRDDAEVKSWDSLNVLAGDGRRKRIGVLEGSAADRF